MSRRPKHEATRAVHARSQPPRLTPVINPPIVRGSTVLASSARALYDHSEVTYGRMGLEPHAALCEALADLEGGEQSFLYPSGLAAVTGVLMALLRTGDEILALDCVYDPTRRFCDTHLKRFGVKTRYADPRLPPEQLVALAGEKTRLVFIESPGSLTMEMVDIPSIVAVAHDRKILVVVDGTYGAGVLNKPLVLGADVSIQALTKYVGGHADVFMGAATAATPALAARLRESQVQIGWSTSPEDVYLMMRGLRTLHTRLARHGENALEVARWLTDQPQVAEVLCPALAGCRDHDLYGRDYAGPNGLFSFVLNPVSVQEVEAFLDRLTLFGLGYSWGGFESLAIHCDPQLKRRTVEPSFAGPLIRLHIGLEDPADLIEDLRLGLDAL
ncbi:MAG TPA: cystathionine beta-lyase [Caulobacteraceae bacterium]|nr:cystathionine beta-lyase [Caulobacteraceae bacterium]